jgi:hypothetical protein
LPGVLPGVRWCGFCRPPCGCRCRRRNCVTWPLPGRLPGEWWCGACLPPCGHRSSRRNSAGPPRRGPGGDTGAGLRFCHPARASGSAAGLPAIGARLAGMPSRCRAFAHAYAARLPVIPVCAMRHFRHRSGAQLSIPPPRGREITTRAEHTAIFGSLLSVYRPTRRVFLKGKLSHDHEELCVWVR